MSEPIDTLRERFNLPGVLIEPGNGGLTRVRVSTERCEGEVYLHGAHVTHYQPTAADPVLWMSSKAAFAAGKGIRGGVPICYPWFGAKADDANAPMHGVARTTEWELVDIKSDELGRVSVVLKLPPSPAIPVLVETFFTVVFGERLTMTLAVENRSSTPYRFEAALHSYFTVGDVRQITVSGLQNETYLDKTRGNASFIDEEAAIRFTAETDRLYQSDDTCVIDDPRMSRRIHIEKTGSPSTVVWNAWPEKAAAIGLAENEWTTYVCVETAAAGSGAITVAPGGQHQLSAMIRADRSQS